MINITQVDPKIWEFTFGTYQDIILKGTIVKTVDTYTVEATIQGSYKIALSDPPYTLNEHIRRTDVAWSDIPMELRKGLNGIIRDLKRTADTLRKVEMELDWDSKGWKLR